MLLLNDSFLLDWHWLDFDELDSTNTSALTYAQKLVPYHSIKPPYKKYILNKIMFYDIF